jgi:hypothetical protein
MSAPSRSAASTFSGGVTNTGTISAGGAGIQFLSTPSVNVFNSGAITGGGGTAIKFDSGINTLTLGPGFAINGNVLGWGPTSSSSAAPVPARLT